MCYILVQTPKRREPEAHKTNIKNITRSILSSSGMLPCSAGVQDRVSEDDTGSEYHHCSFYGRICLVLRQLTIANASPNLKAIILTQSHKC